MAKKELDCRSIRYAVRIARRMELGENEIRSMVQAAIEPHAETSFIPTGMRILEAVRIFEALRPWGNGSEWALTQLKRRAGAQLDGGVVGELLSVIRDDATLSFARRSFQVTREWSAA
ncbi:MAG: hypothetical protein ABR548_01715 [Actinomycetota bacterium]